MEQEEVKVKKRKGRQKGVAVKKEPETVIEDALISPFKIYIDPRCFTIAENNPGGTFEKTYGHYPSFTGALEKLAKLKTITSKKSQSIKEFIETYNANLDLFREKITI